MVTISKSKYMHGLQCPKLLWCEINAPKLVPPVTEATQAIFDQGHEVGDLAKKQYPGGVEVSWEKGFKQTLERTKELVAQRKTIFEASFAHKSAYCRADVLVPVAGGAWDIIEVKGATQVKDENIDDVAFQRYCMEGTGLRIRRCHLMYINNEFVRKGDIDPAKFFTSEDITDQVDKLVPLVEDNLAKMIAMLNGPMPKPALGVECGDPKKCKVCSQDLAKLPENNVTELYYLGKRAYQLLSQGITLIKELPKSFELTDKQLIQQQCAATGKPNIDKKPIKKFLSGLQYPLYLLDFETAGLALPLFDGTRPFQSVPFQLSLHIIDKHGAKPRHVEFLIDSPADPRPRVVETLKAIGPAGTILAYNMSFEKRVIADLADAFPKEKWLRGLIERFEDPLILLRSFAYYHPEQHGSCSIKSVLPAWTGKSYEHLEISHGDEAARIFVTKMYKEGGVDEKLRKALLTYCAQDTEAIIDILKVLEKAVE